MARNCPRPEAQELKVSYKLLTYDEITFLTKDVREVVERNYDWAPAYIPGFLHVRMNDVTNEKFIAKKGGFVQIGREHLEIHSARTETKRELIQFNPGAENISISDDDPRWDECYALYEAEDQRKYDELSRSFR